MRNRILTKFEEIEEIARKIGKIKKVNAVYLFGSQATGEAGKLSDIDLCVVGNLTEEDSYKAASYLSDNLDIVFFNELPIQIKIKVFSEGRVLFIKNREFVDLLKVKTLQEYLDFRQLITKYVRGVLNV